MAEGNFDMQPVTSGNLVAVGFDPETSKIRVQFKAATYEYDDCTQEEFDAIVNAPSANDAFNAHLKNIKPFHKL